jgi:hypothetical protein
LGRGWVGSVVEVLGAEQEFRRGRAWKNGRDVFASYAWWRSITCRGCFFVLLIELGRLEGVVHRKYHGIAFPILVSMYRWGIVLQVGMRMSYFNFIESHTTTVAANGNTVGKCKTSAKEIMKTDQDKIAWSYPTRSFRGCLCLCSSSPFLILLLHLLRYLR